MSKLTINRDWLEPGYVPATLYESVFVGQEHTPFGADVLAAAEDRTPYPGTLGEYAEELLSVVDDLLSAIEGPIYCLLSGGYDSRILALLLESQGRIPLYVMDGAEEPVTRKVLDYLDVPGGRRYWHDMTKPDPYGLAEAKCEGFAPLYSQLDFSPPPPLRGGVTLVTGLGGGEWFSYPASGWHRGKQQRIPHTDPVTMWLDCWPQYTLIPAAWGRGYMESLHPFCTPEYGMVAARCRTDWMVETGAAPELDAVRQAMLTELSETAHTLGYAYHRYDWKLTEDQKVAIHKRYMDSYVGFNFHDGKWGSPAEMDQADHACHMAGFATWVEALIQEGHEVV